MLHFLRLLAIIFIVILWVAIVFHPVVIAFYTGNPLWLLLYFAVYPEIIVGALITAIIIEFLD